MRPSILHVGGTLYWVIQTRDPDTMVLKDADSTPSVVVRKNGASVGDSVTITKRSATTGIYDCSYNPAAEVEGDSFTFEESATVTGTTTSSATYVNQFSVHAVHAGAVELDSGATDLIQKAVDGTAYLLAINAGAVSDPRQATSTYVLTAFGATYTSELQGQTEEGVRTAPTLSKA